MHRQKKWNVTYDQLLKAYQEAGLEPHDLMTYALSAYLTGRDAESFQILERAHQGFLDRRQPEEAIRCAFWLGLMLFTAGEKARGSGWIARGERLLNDDKGSKKAVEGLLLIPGALGALSGGHTSKALELFQQAAAIGEQFSDVDLMALGRLGHGQAMIQQGNIAQGLKLLDETMITVETQEVFPIACGIIYCAVIETCRKVWDLGRAKEWTSALSRWCAAQPDIVPFRGQCLVRRAEIIQFHGEWQKALEESRSACKLLTRPPGEAAAGEAYYRQAELLRLLGNFDEAEFNYHEASKWGRNPQPGLALLRMAQGQHRVAETSIKNTLQETKDILKRSDLLPAVIRIMIAVKEMKESMDASEELGGIALDFDTPFLHAMSSYCQGAVQFAGGDVQEALGHLKKALNIWTTLHLPYESALTRELIGQVYRELDDTDNANVELLAAKWIFEQLEAKPDLERIHPLLNQKNPHQDYRLTLRELQVLHLVASGKTNKFIAGELFISERTVDRHVSNIFNKLSVSSRAEATAFAFKNNILNQGI